MNFWHYQLAQLKTCLIQHWLPMYCMLIPASLKLYKEKYVFCCRHNEEILLSVSCFPCMCSFRSINPSWVSLSLPVCSSSVASESEVCCSLQLITRAVPLLQLSQSTTVWPCDHLRSQFPFFNPQVTWCPFRTSHGRCFSLSVIVFLSKMRAECSRWTRYNVSTYFVCNLTPSP